MLRKSTKKATPPPTFTELVVPYSDEDTSQLAQKIEEIKTDVVKEQAKPENFKYYTLTDIFSKHATYNVIFGERSNGKTYACLKYMIEQYVKFGHQGALIRRWKEDFRGKRGQVMFEAFSDGMIYKLTKGEYNTTYYYSGKWYFANKDDNLDRLIPASEPFCYGFALSDVEHDKSTSYPRIKTIFFDEFLTRQYYLPDEFVTFMNVVSTIVRQRDDVTIIMAGNTVNKYCPYFTEMGLTHVSEMKQGTIEVYNYGESKLKVAVEYADSISEKGKPSDVYFAFNNPKLEMITGGSWEMAMYPHLPAKYNDSDIVFTFFMEFNQETLQCEVIQTNLSTFIYIHRKSTPLRDEDHDVIYSMEYDPRPNHIRNMKKSRQSVNKKINWYFNENKVYYQDNEIGEIVRNYLVQCVHDAQV